MVLGVAGIAAAGLVTTAQAQSNSPTNNSPTNSVSTGPSCINNEFNDANSRADCDRILQEKLKEIDDRWKEKKDAWDPALECDKTYDVQLKMNNLQRNIDVANAVNSARSIFLGCVGFGSAVGGGAVVGMHRLTSIRGGLVMVARIGSAVAVTIVSFATFAFCRNLEKSTLQSSMAAIDAAKEHADREALRKREVCRKSTDYEHSRRTYWKWRGGGKRKCTYRNKRESANEDPEECVEQFSGQDGNCGGN